MRLLEVITPLLDYHRETVCYARSVAPGGKVYLKIRELVAEADGMMPGTWCNVLDRDDDTDYIDLLVRSWSNNHYAKVRLAPTEIVRVLAPVEPEED